MFVYDIPRLFLISIFVLCASSLGNEMKPNIVYIIADDLGWDDVSFHGSDLVQTPNIDMLAYTGVALGRFYTHCLCTPSRSALLTGKHAYTLGMQGYPLVQSEDRYLPLDQKILPQYLKEMGYATHLVGKWHVGLSRTQALPTMRGFDSHFGHRGGYIDYYEYALEELWNETKVSGYDLYRDMTPAWDAEGYITDLYNDEAKSIIARHDASSPLFLMVSHNAPHAGNDGAELQAPPGEVRRMRHIESQQRRIMAAMIKKLDDSVGDIVKSLSEKGILNNTIIVFTSDNGGISSEHTTNYGSTSNWPLRGTKISPFEGGLRVPGLLWKANLNPVSRLWNGYMHISDWLPTLLRATGVDPPSDLDGFDQWDNIINNKTSNRTEIFEMDDYSGFYAVISGEYKLITGQVNKPFSDYQGHELNGDTGSIPSYTDALKRSSIYSVLQLLGTSFKIGDEKLRNELQIDCNIATDKRDKILCSPENGTCLYNIKEDPCETKDLTKTHPETVSRLMERLEKEKQRLVPRTVVPVDRDPRSRPSLHNFSWTTWADNIERDE